MAIPTLSVHITSYNYGRFLRQTIESVLNQTFKDFELIIVDDASTDNSVELIKSYAAKDSRISLIEHNHNQGYASSIIEVSKLSQGKYLVHIDSDDWIRDPQAFELQVELMEQHPEVSFVYSPLAHYDNEGNCKFLMQAYKQDQIQPGAVEVEKVFGRFVPHTGTLIRATAYQACGGYDPGYHYALDLKLWLDLCEHGKVAYINRLLYAYRQHETSMSRDSKLGLWQAELLRAIDSVFNGPLSTEIVNPSDMYKRVVQTMLMSNPVHDIFESRYRRGWEAYFISCKQLPAQTLFQKLTLILILRTILGERGFRDLERLYAKFNSKKRQRLLEEKASGTELITN